MDVVMLVNQVQAAAKNVRDHKHMVAQLAGRIGALQSLIVSLVEDNGQACPPEFLERLQVRGRNMGHAGNCASCCVVKLCTESFRSLLDIVLGWSLSEHRKRVKTESRTWGKSTRAQESVESYIRLTCVCCSCSDYGRFLF